jgi:hypothetical protein
LKHAIITSFLGKLRVVIERQGASPLAPEGIRILSAQSQAIAV